LPPFLPVDLQLVALPALGILKIPASFELSILVDSELY
jgi:hypothetical protein